MSTQARWRIRLTVEPSSGRKALGGARAAGAECAEAAVAGALQEPGEIGYWRAEAKAYRTPRDERRGGLIKQRSGRVGEFPP